jgi:cysteinyl-tRNA synthetase
MSWKHLGETFDIHGGGIDLVFPHHENEIAQSRCALHAPVMANYWMHNGFLQVEGEKMSKSLGNFVTIRELLSTANFGGRRWQGEVLRLAMLKTHYRQPIDWTVKSLEEAEKTLNKWYDVIGDVPAAEPSPSVLDPMLDDLNSAESIAALHQLEGGSPIGLALAITKAPMPSVLKASANMLGLLSMTKTEWRLQQTANAQINVEVVEKLIAARIDARKQKNFNEADRIRDELSAIGVVLKDSKDGTTWEIAR